MHFIKKLRVLPFMLVLLFASQSCSLFEEEEDEEPIEARQETSIIPDTYAGRTVRVAGTVGVSSKRVTFKVWDSQTVDGDIVTLVVNGRVILAEYSLVAEKREITVTLDNLGYNYILLFAHNVGSLPPNTAAMSITDSSGVTKNLTLSANLNTNEAYNIVVD